MKNKTITSELYQKIVEAEEAARYAHDFSLDEDAPLRLRTALGRVQSILMHFVVKYASVGVPLCPRCKQPYRYTKAHGPGFCLEVPDQDE